MAEQEDNEKYGEISLRTLGLPSVKRLPNLTLDQREAYWRVARALWSHKEGRAVYREVVQQLPVAVAMLRTLWPTLPAGIPTGQTMTRWLEGLREATDRVIASMKPPPPPKMVQYLYQVAQLTDVASLDSLAQSDIVPLRLDALWNSPPSVSVLPAAQVVLMFSVVNRSKRTTLLRMTLDSDEASGTFRLGAPPDLAINRQAFFTPAGEPRGDYGADEIGEILLAPLPDSALVVWSDLMLALDARCQQLFGEGLLALPVHVFGAHAGDLRAFLVDAEKLSSMGLAKLLGPVARAERAAPLLHAALAKPPEQQRISLRTARRDLFLGHMDERTPGGRVGFPLDPTQRLAAMTATMLREEGAATPILPVNGPPGTGKTSFLRAVLASTWVRAAYERAKYPPLVVGTGATNKAVSNVIEAFSTVADLAGPGISSRWLTGLPSYGWLYPSKDAKEKFPDLMHLQYEAATRRHFVPGGGASEFHLVDIDQHLQAYVSHAIAGMSLARDRAWSVDEIVDLLHRRIVSNVDALRSEQTAFAQALSALRSAWSPARGSGHALADAQQRQRALTTEVQRQTAASDALADALPLVRQCLELHERFERPAVKWLRRLSFDRLYRDLKQSLDQQSSRVESALASLGFGWPASYRERQAVYDEIVRKLNEADSRLEATRQALKQVEVEQHRVVQVRTASRAAIRAVLERLHTPARMPPGERHNLVYALRFARATDASVLEAAENMLWHRFDAQQDVRWRFALFHLAARYWEGRWLLMPSTQEQRSENDDALSRLMMLGVIIVATTHKLPKIGESAPIDLLVVDESGQCAPEVGAAMLSFARSALLVGDTKQLQPVPGLTAMQSDHLARTLDLVVPNALCAARGSAMAMARYCTPFTDGVDGGGVTLLYHYRCHPTIIGYCNGLLYGGQIRCVRPSVPTPAGLPPMSWVEVAGQPVQQGSSMENVGELEEIARWIRETHRRLSESYGKPLDEVLAVITPLRAQANKAKAFLQSALAGEIAKDVLERITIGTVHALQGAERPVVVFSLVQHRRLGKLFAERDGGFLMNVAVSRAKDAFILFGDRDSVRPGPMDTVLAPADAVLPVGQLGTYFREHGSRLYPRRLVVVEAKNKVDRIQQALGTDCAVIPTNGYLGNWSLQTDQTLTWSPPPAEFVTAMKRHAGLLQELLVATDDDLAGELIGLQVAEVAATTLGAIPVRRMRFHSLEFEHLRDAMTIAGHRFDADMLAAGLLREVMNALDQARFTSRLPQQPYVGEAERAMVALVAERDQDAAQTVEVRLSDAQSGHTFVGYVPQNPAILASPSRMDTQTANALATALQGAPAVVVAQGEVARVPALYPASTTQRILAAAADELGMMPWEAQGHLNAMYQAGARPETAP